MDQTEFQKWVKLAFDEGIRITQRFEIPKSAAKHWAKGESVPAPFIQSLVVRYIKDMLEKKKLKNDPQSGAQADSGQLKPSQD